MALLASGNLPENSITARLVALIALSFTTRVLGEDRSQRYRQALAAAEQEKAQGDFSATEPALAEAFQEAGPNDGYVLSSRAPALS